MAKSSHHSTPRDLTSLNRPAAAVRQTLASMLCAMSSSSATERGKSLSLCRARATSGSEYPSQSLRAASASPLFNSPSHAVIVLLVAVDGIPEVFPKSRFFNAGSRPILRFCYCSSTRAHVTNDSAAGTVIAARACVRSSHLRFEHETAFTCTLL